MNKRSYGTLAFVSGFIAVFALVLMLSSCATMGFTGSTYQTLGTMASGYNVAWLSFRQAYNDKVTGKDGKLLVDEPTYQTGKKYANDFYTQYQKAVDLLARYKAGEGSQSEVNRSLDLAKNFSDILRGFILSKGVSVPDVPKP